VDEDREVVAVFDYYDSIMGTPPDRDCSISFEHLDLPHLDLHHLYDRFTEAVFGIENHLEGG
jgi:hypothetical protein